VYSRSNATGLSMSITEFTIFEWIEAWYNPRRRHSLRALYVSG
jgi:transposase InsO family protein